MKKENIHPFDLAQQLEQYDLNHQVKEFLALDNTLRIEVFEYLSSYHQQNLLESLDNQIVNEIFSELDNDDIDDILEDNEELISRLSLHNQSLAQNVLQYPEDSAGRLMLQETFYVQLNESVAEVIKRIRDEEYPHFVSTIFVLDNQKLVGFIQISDLLLNKDNTKVNEFVREIAHYVEAEVDQEDVVKIFTNYDLIVLAVVDDQMNYLGYISSDYIMDVMVEESDEDFTKMSAITPLEDSYLETSVFDHVKKRFTWLMVLMITATITGALLVRYEHAFEAVPLLVSFIPMLMDTGGNAGSQSSTLVIRGLATSEIRLKDTLKVLSKEFKISFVTSILLAIVNFIRIVLLGYSIQIGFVVSITLILTVIIAKLIGAMLPILADRFKLDPAVMSAPLITTVVDTCSIIIYFNIAIQFFNI